MRETGFTGDLRRLHRHAAQGPALLRAPRAEDLLEKASEIAKRIDDQLPRLLRRPCRGCPTACGRCRPRSRPPTPPPATSQGAAEQGVAGGYMVNTSRWTSARSTSCRRSPLHEAVPGHHLQIALAQELEDVPTFRRDADVTAFVEGWGLYSERLAGEMGIYRDPYERFGQLSYEMWRACRLVADTGIHWKGWTREQAEACFTGEHRAGAARTSDARSTATSPGRARRWPTRSAS